MAERATTVPVTLPSGRLGPVAWLRALALRSEALRGYSLLSPTLGVLLFALALPVGLLVTLSFWTQVYIDFDKSFTLVNYVTFFKKLLYPYLLGKSIVMSGMVTIATVVLAYPMAYFIAFKVTRHKLLWLILITVPF